MRARLLYIYCATPVHLICEQQAPSCLHTAAGIALIAALFTSTQQCSQRKRTTAHPRAASGLHHVANAQQSMGQTCFAERRRRRRYMSNPVRSCAQEEPRVLQRRRRRQWWLRQQRQQRRLRRWRRRQLICIKDFCARRRVVSNAAQVPHNGGPAVVSQQQQQAWAVQCRYVIANSRTVHSQLEQRQAALPFVAIQLRPAHRSTSTQSVHTFV
jgi:hypothetical protein